MCKNWWICLCWSWNFTRNYMISIFPRTCSNIPAAPAYEVQSSQLIWYWRAYGSYHNSWWWILALYRGLLLTRKLLNQVFLASKLKSLITSKATMTYLKVTECLCLKWTRICSVCRNHNPTLSSLMTYHGVCKESKMMGATSGAGTAYLSGAP